MRAAGLFALAICVSLWCGNRLLAAEPDGLAARLRTQWLEEARSVKTVEIQVEFFQYLAEKGRPLARDRMERFLEESRKAWAASGQGAAIREKSRALELSQFTLAQAWREGFIRVEGEKVRNNFQTNLIPNALYEELDACFDGSVDIHFVKESKQAWVTEKGPSFKRFGLRDVWCLGPTQPNARIVERSGTRVTFDATPARYVVDAETGAVTEATIRTGQSARTITQFGFGRYDVGGRKIVFPSVNASVESFGNEVRFAFLFIVKSVQFNRPLGPNAFAVPLPVDTAAVYYPSPDKVLIPSLEQARLSPPFAMRTDKPIDDARTLLPKLRAGAEARKKPISAALVPVGRSHRWSVLLVANIAAAILIVAWLFFRRRKLSP